MKIHFPILLILFPAIGFTQGFVSKTNDVHFDFAGTPVNSMLPVIHWVTPGIEASFSQNSSLDIEAEVTSPEHIRELGVIVTNGNNSSTKRMPLDGKVNHKTISLTIQLMDGSNTIEIYVENEKRAKVSSERSVMVGKEIAMEAVDANRKDYALIFCTDKYEHWEDLVNPVNDGRAIESVLKEKYGFVTEVVENATMEEVLGKLYDYNTRKFRSQDQLFIFFAGHGYFDATLGEGYVVASNSLENDKAKTTYIPHTVLRQRIDNIRAEHIFLAMDVCFGGTIDPLLTKSRNIDVYGETSDSEYLAKKLSRRTRKFLTSGSMEYVSDGIPGRHSPFAAKFIQALREVGNGKDRLLTLSELETYFQKLTTEARYGSFGSDDRSSDFVFVARP